MTNPNKPLIQLPPSIDEAVAMVDRGLEAMATIERLRWRELEIQTVIHELVLKVDEPANHRKVIAAELEEDLRQVRVDVRRSADVLNLIASRLNGELHVLRSEVASLLQNSRLSDCFHLPKADSAPEHVIQSAARLLAMLEPQPALS